MKKARQSKLRLYQLPLAVGVLLMGFGLTGLAWRYTSYTGEQKTKLQLDTQVKDAVNALDARINVYLNTFYAARGLWTADRLDVSYERWRSFVTSLELQERYPGINGLGFIRYVPGNREAYIQQTRSKNSTFDDAYANYIVKPEGTRSEYFVIEYAEPIQRNRKAIGLDVGHEPVRRAGAERARDTGKPAATGRIILVQDTQKTPGLLAYLPIYRSGLPTSTVDERRKAFFGFIYAPFRVLDLVKEGIPSSIQQNFDLVIYNGKDLIYGQEQDFAKNRSDASRYYKYATLNVAGENWELHFISNPNALNTDKALPIVVAITGTIASLLLSGIVWSLAIAYSKTREAKEAADTAKQVSDTANQAKSEFLANMSHELRTPLNGILGYAQILQRSEQLDEKGRKGIDIIYQCGSHLLTLINDILDISKIEARKLELHPTPFHLPSVLQGVAEVCRIRAEQKYISFDFQPDSQLPIGVCGDEKRLRQVLINLLGNAVKFTDKGGVTFKVDVLEKLKPGASAQSAFKIRFQVEDTGVGMTPEQVEKIFLPFEQVGDTRKQIEGTGLGLAISQKIVSLMQSEIQVQSHPGSGSTFSFVVELPEAENWSDASRVLQHGKIIGYQGHKRKLLIVDDRWENRSVLVNLLAPIGFEMIEANHGQEGIEKALETKPDLIITDLAMPVMDGFEFLRKLRSHPELKDQIVLVSSASVFDADRHQSLRAGGNDFLPKPVQTDTLLQLLQHYLQLTWLEDTTQTATPMSDSATIAESMQIPEREILEQIAEFADTGDVFRIVDIANQLQEFQTEYSSFAKELIRLAENFQIKQLRAFIQQYLD